MQRRSFLSCAAAACAALAFSQAEPVAAASGMTKGEGAHRLSGPFTHDNLAIYLVHGAPGGGPVPLTLQEALEKGSFKVYETSDVNELAVQNLGADPVFVQSGDIVKGGRQDRVLTVSLVLPPKSDRVSIGAFCVEQGRWRARGQERADSFSSAAEALPSRAAKLAIKSPKPMAGGRAEDIGSRQHEVWRGVAEMQDKFGKSLGTSVAAQESPSSLQLALEHERLQESRAAYYQALHRVATREPDIVGYVFAINGKVNSADVYPSNGLFLKMWPKLLKASAAEAIAERDGNPGTTAPSIPAVAAFLERAEGGRARRDTLSRHAELETREADEAFFFESRAAGGGWVHRNYLAK